MRRNVRPTHQDVPWVLAILCLPVLCFLGMRAAPGAYDESRRRKRERIARIRKPPGHNISRQRRSLSLPPPRTQPACSLMELPVEIRQQIWKECLGGFTFHLRLRQTLEDPHCHLYHNVCQSLTPDICEEYSRQVGRIAPCRDPSRRWVYIEEPKLHLLSILLTCRQTYSEAIRYLYQSNSFVATHPDVVQLLPKFFLPQRLDDIRSFRFMWLHSISPGVFPEPDPQNSAAYDSYILWTTIWTNLADMHGLAELRVKLVAVAEMWGNMETEKAIELLRPIMNVTSPRIFELVVNFPCGSDEALWEALPCHIRRTHGLSQEM